MGRFTKRGVMLFFGGFVAGSVATLAVLICAALIDFHLHGDYFLSGEFDDYYVEANEEGDEYFEQSIDIFLDNKVLARFGKRKWAGKPDFAMLYPGPKVVAHVLLDRMENKPPAIFLYNDSTIISKIRLSDENGSEPKAYYGLYADPNEARAGDTSYVDNDFDGRFDVRDHFNDRVKISKTYVLYDGKWHLAINNDDLSDEAKIWFAGDYLELKFVHGEGWCEK